MLHEKHNFDGYYKDRKEEAKKFLLTPPEITYDAEGYAYIHVWELNKLFNCNIISANGKNRGKVTEIDITRFPNCDFLLSVYVKIEWENGNISDIIDDDFISTILLGKITIE